MNEAAPPRTLSALLLLGILMLPVIFVWFFLRRGYSNSLRFGAFLYLALGVAITLIGTQG